MDLSRRDIIKGSAVVAASTLLSSGTVTAQSDTVTVESDAPIQPVSFLFGLIDDNPNNIPELQPGNGFFEGDNWEKAYYAYVYRQPSGAEYYITQEMNQWEPLEFTNYTVVSSQSDLPSPENGVHPLENRVYWFNGFTTSPYSLDISNGPVLLGRHASMDRFIHTGTNTAITGFNGQYMQDSLYVHAPGGTLYNLSGDQSTEMLVTDSAFSDAANIGQIASLGTITGFRVPTWKNCNFEDFAGGITFDGSPDKIFITDSPFRGVTAPNVTVLTFASTLDVDIVDIPNNYVKAVQSDTEVIRVETGGTPSDIFQYRGTTHDSSVVESNILTGEASTEAVGFRVDGSYPLPDSGIAGELDLDTLTTVTGSGAAPTQIVGPTTLTNPERVSTPSDGVLQYDGQKRTKELIHTNLDVSGANTEFAVWIALNGSVLPRTKTLGFLPNANNPVGIVAVATIKLTEGDQLSVFLENTGGSADLDIEKMALTI